MGGSHPARLETALSGSHGPAWCPFLCRVHLEQMDPATAAVGIPLSGARLGIRDPRPDPLAASGRKRHHTTPSPRFTLGLQAPSGGA